jgi:hypothetical protein
VTSYRQEAKPAQTMSPQARLVIMPAPACTVAGLARYVTAGAEDELCLLLGTSTAAGRQRWGRCPSQWRPTSGRLSPPVTEYSTLRSSGMPRRASSDVSSARSLRLAGGARELTPGWIAEPVGETWKQFVDLAADLIHPPTVVRRLRPRSHHPPPTPSRIVMVISGAAGAACGVSVSIWPRTPVLVDFHHRVLDPIWYATRATVESILIFRPWSAPCLRHSGCRGEERRGLGCRAWLKRGGRSPNGSDGRCMG